MKNLLLLLTLIFVAVKASASGNPDAILGTWSNGSNKGQIQVYKQNDKYYGKIIWLKAPNDNKGLPKVDKNNPDQKVRSKPLLGLIMLRDFKYDDEEWTDGKIYNPDDGKEYKAYMRLKGNETLWVRGYIGFSFIGKTETFHRVRSS
jgi:uncharacterized protein (DUF2147 family)